MSSTSGECPYTNKVVSPFVAELQTAKEKGLYVSVLMRGSYKYVSGNIDKVGDIMVKLKNGKGHVLLVVDDIRMIMTYEGEDEK